MAGTTVIRGGTVIDGTGSPGQRADVAISEGRIAEIGPGLDGDVVIDAEGAVVSPGFIDIHTHYDAQVFWDPALTPSCFHGVTTVVAGNCGFSLAPTRPEHRDRLVSTMEKVEDMNPATLTAGIPWSFESFPEYLRAVAAAGPVLNFAAYVGHTPMRMYVMGDEASERAATTDETSEMATMVSDAMEAGAAGFATSFGIAHRDGEGRPIPSRFATREEIVTLGAVVGGMGRGVVAVNGGEGLTFAETYDLQAEIGAPITFTALLTGASGQHLRALDLHRIKRAEGIDVYPQVSCRPLTFSMTMLEPFTLNTNPVFAELSGRSLDERRAAFGDRAWRQRVRDAWAERKGFVPRWDTYSIMVSTAHPDLVGRPLLDVPSAGDALDVLLDLALDEPELALRVKAVVANDDIDGVEILLREEGCVLGLSDAGAHVGQLCDAPLPTDLLGNWVRERHTLPLEEAVRKLTSEPATLFGFADRGVLRPGAFADITVFDADTVAPGPLRRVRDFPAGGERLTADDARGIQAVLVGGTMVVDEGVLCGDALERRPGRIVSPS